MADRRMTKQIPDPGGSRIFEGGSVVEGDADLGRFASFIAIIRCLDHKVPLDFYPEANGLTGLATYKPRCDN